MNRDQKDESMGGKDTAFGWSSTKADKESKMSNSSNWATEKVDEEILAAERALKEKALNRAKETPPPPQRIRKKAERAKASEIQTKETPKRNDVAEVVLDDSEPPSAKEANKKPQEPKANPPPEKKKDEPL